MKFHFTFTETATGKVTECDGGRTSLWDAQDLSDTWPERKSNEGRADFAWGYFAAKCAGIMKQLGIDAMDAEEAIAHLADNYDLHIGDNKAPLAGGQPE